MLPGVAELQFEMFVFIVKSDRKNKIHPQSQTQTPLCSKADQEQHQRLEERVVYGVAYWGWMNQQ